MIREQIWQKCISGKRFCRTGLVLLIACMGTGFGNHPTALSSSRDIRRAPSDVERIIIGQLPIKDYPLLSKLQRLKDVDFYTLDGTGANDDKLRELSKLKLDNLEGISLLNCPVVTDGGIRHLSRIPSLKHMQLEGTSITDEALEIMASDMSLTGVNVANCPKITKQGLLKIAASTTLVTFTFSADALTQEDVVRLIGEFGKNVKWPSVVDREGKLDAAALKAAARKNGITLNVSRTGALQDVVRGGGWR